MTDALSFTGKRWLFGAPLDVGPGSAGPSANGALVDALLLRRGVMGEEAVRDYLAPSLNQLPEPLTMADMAAAVDILVRAVQHQTPIVVYGDYDVDGVSSTAVLVDFLRQVGATVSFYIPDRRSEGYGLNVAAVEKLVEQSPILVTTDCGITASDEVRRAKELGAQVVIVDHHKVPDELPPADACLDPHRGDCGFAFKGLCATGVAFMLAVAMRRALRALGHFDGARPEPDVRELLDIVALATVADMVPLNGLNRVLVASGLRRFATTRRAGLAALCDVAQVDRHRVTAMDLGFRIAPRINARGRLSHAGAAVDLLLTQDLQEAQTLAQALDDANQARKELEKRTVALALAKVEAEGLGEQAGVVVSDANWHPGVLGLVATRLCQALHRPCIAIGEGGKGSGRAVMGLDLHKAIAAGEAHLLRFGGHHAAAGVTILAENVPAFRAAFSAAVLEQLGSPPYVPVLKVDLEVPEAAWSMNVLCEVDRLAPFGMENPEPLWVSRNVVIQQKRKVGDNHLKLQLGAQGLDAIAFGMAELMGSLPGTVDVAFRLSRNLYRGRESLQLLVEDLRAASSGD